MNKHNRSWLPKQFLWRLSITNIIVITAFIILSSWSIYNTACSLADGLGTLSNQKQKQFNSILFQYLWIFSIAAIVIGSLVHFYITKKLIDPLRELIKSTKRMKEGRYPEPLAVKSNDETGELIGQFNDLIQQIKVNQEQRQKLVSDLSHEFRTPLSNLNGYLNALSNGVIEGDENLFQDLYDESRRLTNMVKQLEQLKEWDYISNQKFFEKESSDMHQIVRQSAEMFYWSLEKARIRIDVQSDHGIVKVDHGGISQVISNLIENAIQYYEGAGPIQINGLKQDSNYKVTVSGPGQPIPAAEHSEIFERFHRTDFSRSKFSGGTGLGLAISKEIIERHNGNIGVQSNGDIHTFWITLPLSEGSSE
ncbi:sensor histidine kinase [Virgibacillus ihumii]|uniref:sensor histidine kinase n=1 Tax=Virgibacillus ihumii TaxID=2686091 RepID=UPI00157D9D31|nr:ATP-binding protein [Virgibacillus ihumii]